MEGKASLRQYLEQQRELGETEILLDALGVDEVLRILGTSGSGGSLRQSAKLGDDWRENLRAIGAKADAPKKSEPVAYATHEISRKRGEFLTAAAAPAAEVPQSPISQDEAYFKPGLIVGTGDTELFTGPIGGLRSLESIAEEVKDCTRCPLYSTATHPVPGEGSPKARLVCVGEAPGANEDATGRPFVGRAGGLLTKILAAIDLTREEVFICNVLKHRPPSNRNPRPDEIEACSPYLIRQIELIKPKVIVAFGTFAAQTLLQTKTPIGKLRGLVHRYHGTPLVVTYHPAALLRNPSWKRPTWDDVKLARRILDSPTKP